MPAQAVRCSTHGAFPYTRRAANTATAARHCVQRPQSRLKLPRLRIRRLLAVLYPVRSPAAPLLPVHSTPTLRCNGRHCAIAAIRKHYHTCAGSSTGAPRRPDARSIHSGRIARASLLLLWHVPGCWPGCGHAAERGAGTCRLQAASH
jgi:hypothetical protein